MVGELENLRNLDKGKGGDFEGRRVGNGKFENWRDADLENWKYRMTGGHEDRKT